MTRNNGKNKKIPNNNINRVKNNGEYLGRFKENHTLIIRFDYWKQVSTIFELYDEIEKLGKDVKKSIDFLKAYYSEEQNVKFLICSNLFRLVRHNKKMHDIQNRIALYTKLHTIFQLTNNDLDYFNVIEYVLEYIKSSSDFKDNKTLLLLITRDFLNVLEKNKTKCGKVIVNDKKPMEVRLKYNEYYKLLDWHEKKAVESFGQLLEEYYESIREKKSDLTNNMYNNSNAKAELEKLKKEDKMLANALKESSEFVVKQQYADCDTDSERLYNDFRQVNLYIKKQSFPAWRK